MTTKDSELIADVINESRVCFEDKDDATIKHIAEHFAAVLPRTNPRFDRERFLRTCGVESGYEATDDRGKKTLSSAELSYAAHRPQHHFAASATPPSSAARIPRPAHAALGPPE